MKEQLIPLCRLADIADPGSKGFSVESDIGPLELFLVRRGEEIYGYLNRCPHTGAPLDWQPDQFLDASGRFIQCATHGALFRVEDGGCLQGPCAGQRLQPMAVILCEGIVRLPVPVAAPRN